MTDPPTIAIWGATGKIGGAAAAELRRRGQRVRAVLRDPAKGDALRQLGCDIVTGDLYERHAIQRALDGAEEALFVCPLRRDAEDLLSDTQQIINALGGALETARPRRVVAISDYGAYLPAGTGITMIFHRLETRLRAVPSSITFLRSAEHMQNWSRHLEGARTRGKLASLHHPVTKLLPTVSAFDVGLVAADILTAPPDDDRASPRVVHVEGPRRYSAVDVARVFEQQLQRSVSAEAIPRERWMSALAAGGLGESYAKLVVELAEAHNAGSIDVEPGAADVRRGTTELSTALAAAP